MIRNIIRISNVFSIILALLLSLVVWYSNEVQQASLTLYIFVTLTLIISLWVTGSTFNASRKIDPFHPAALFALFALFYVGLSASLIWLLNGYNSTWFDLGNNNITLFNKALCLLILACFFYGLGLRFPIQFSSNEKLSGVYRALDEYDLKALKAIAYLFFVFGFIATAYNLSLFGSENLLLYLSPSAKKEGEVGVSQLILLIESMLAWSAIFFIIIMLRTKIQIVPLALVLVGASMVYIVSGKRTAVIPIFLIPLMYHHYCHNWLSLGKAARYFLGLLVFIVIGVLGRMALPLVAQGIRPSDYMGDSSLAVLEYYAISGEFMTFDMFLFSMLKSQVILEEIGGVVYGFLYYSVATVSMLVPRAVWPGKPDFWDLGNVYQELIVGGGEVGFAVTIFGTSYLFFGVIGLMLGMFLFAAIQRGIYEWLRPYDGGLANVLYYAVGYWMVFQAMRFGTFGFTFVVFVQTMSVGVLAIWLMSRIKEIKTYHYRIINNNDH